MTDHIACNDAKIIPSIDGVSIAIHDFGGQGTPVLVSHATGFHAHCFAPLAEQLCQNHKVVGFDHRGYGDAQAIDPATIEWKMYGNDALAAARYLSLMTGQEKIIGVGHSMGGASLLMAAHRDPSLFAALVVFEPIVFPPPSTDAAVRPDNPLAGGARKRRSRFPNFEEALENFSSKPPMSTFHPDARAAYVKHGFFQSDQGDIALKCSPEHEARTYETGGTSGAWNDLPSIQTPVWVVSGAPAPFQPSSFALNVAEQIPHATYIQYDELGHFGPLERPDILATLVEHIASQLP